MQILLYFVVASLIVIGQGLWKFGIDKMALDSANNDLLGNLLALITQPFIILGLLIYGVATILYMYVLGKYQYGASYAAIVSLSLIFATATSVFFFHERFKLINALGIILIVLGITLVLKK
jgi:multidrug transporter EmrE-like cation transporter